MMACGLARAGSAGNFDGFDRLSGFFRAPKSYFKLHVKSVLNRTAYRVGFQGVQAFDALSECRKFV